jgi:hypothetical protein
MNLPLLKTNIDIKLSAHDAFHKKRSSPRTHNIKRLESQLILKCLVESKQKGVNSIVISSYVGLYLPENMINASYLITVYYIIVQDIFKLC